MDDQGNSMDDNEWISKFTSSKTEEFYDPGYSLTLFQQTQIDLFNPITEEKPLEKQSNKQRKPVKETKSKEELLAEQKEKKRLHHLEASRKLRSVRKNAITQIQEKQSEHTENFEVLASAVQQLIQRTRVLEALVNKQNEILTAIVSKK